LILGFASNRNCSYLTASEALLDAVGKQSGRAYLLAERGTVLRELPENGGETQYRIKSGREAHERVVNESEIGIGLS